MNYNCPKCSSDFISGTKFCQSCGCNLEVEFIEKPTCPKCKVTYPTNTKFCIVDGSKLLSPEDVVPKCSICNTSYSDDIKFCPLDGGVVKNISTRQISEPVYITDNHFENFKNQKYLKASLGNRFLAYFLDAIISILFSIPAIIFLIKGLNRLKSYESDLAPTLFLIAILFYLLPVVYNLIKDGLGRGQSFGKRTFDLMVINLEDNTPCDKGKSFLRNFISILLAIIPFVGWLIDPIMVLASEDGRKLGDKVANTQVINKKTFN